MSFFPEFQLLHAEITDESKSVLWSICCLIGFARESRRIHHGVCSFKVLVSFFWTKMFHTFFKTLINSWFIEKTESCVEKESRLKPKYFLFLIVRLQTNKVNVNRNKISLPKQLLTKFSCGCCLVEFWPWKINPSITFRTEFNSFGSKKWERCESKQTLQKVNKLEIF